MSVALFIHAHQDDEVLSFGGDILGHIANGVHVYHTCITDGSASEVFADFPGMQMSDFIKTRNTEMVKALSIYPGCINLEAKQGPLMDGQLNMDLNLGPNDAGYSGNDIQESHVNMGIVTRIRDVLGQIVLRENVAIKDIMIKSPSYQDAHEDHRAVSQAVLYMLHNGEIRSDVRQYLSPDQWDTNITYRGSTFMSASQIPTGCDLARVYSMDGHLMDSVLEHTATNISYGAYYGRAQYGVGYKSVGNLFAKVMAERCSYWHVPPTLIL